MTPDLDDLIDGAAREMTDAPSPVDLRARVVAEIRRAGVVEWGGRRAEAWARKPAAWLAAAAGIILAAYVAWPERQPAAPTIAQATVAAPAPVEPGRVAPPAARPERGQVPRAVRPPDASATPQEESVASIPALDAPPALDIAPLDATMQEVPQLDAIAPLDTAPLDIRPLTPLR